MNPFPRGTLISSTSLKNGARQELNRRIRFLTNHLTDRNLKRPIKQGILPKCQAHSAGIDHQFCVPHDRNRTSTRVSIFRTLLCFCIPLSVTKPKRDQPYSYVHTYLLSARGFRETWYLFVRVATQRVEKFIPTCGSLETSPRCKTYPLLRGSS